MDLDSLVDRLPVLRQHPLKVEFDSKHDFFNGSREHVGGVLAHSVITRGPEWHKHIKVGIDDYYVKSEKEDIPKEFADFELPEDPGDDPVSAFNKLREEDRKGVVGHFKAAEGRENGFFVRTKSLDFLFGVLLFEKLSGKEVFNELVNWVRIEGVEIPDPKEFIEKQTQRVEVLKKTKIEERERKKLQKREERKKRSEAREAERKKEEEKRKVQEAERKKKEEKEMLSGLAAGFKKAAEAKKKEAEARAAQEKKSELSGLADGFKNAKARVAERDGEKKGKSPLGSKEADGTPTGFVTSSFVQGMNPTEHFIHMSSSQEGIIHTHSNPGLVRKPLMGKRHQMTGRSVIDPGLMSDTGRDGTSSSGTDTGKAWEDLRRKIMEEGGPRNSLLMAPAEPRHASGFGQPESEVFAPSSPINTAYARKVVSGEYVVAGQDPYIPGREEVRLCVACGKPGSKRCSRCKKVNYCSGECQGSHWGTHKGSCSSI